jgi:hypothetical protein
MTYTGKVQNGVVVLPPEAHLPEGTEVIVEPALLTAETDSLVALFEEIARPRPHWPEGYGRNLDHYLYGAEKQP